MENKLNIPLILFAGYSLFATLYGWAFYFLRDRDRLGPYPSFDAEAFNRRERKRWR